MRIGHLLASGRSADVYALDEGRVLRRYRSGHDATGEAVLMAHLSASGFPVPRVHPGGEARTDLVMDRLSGPTMAQALLSGSMAAEEGGETLARLLGHLHTVPARAGNGPGDRILHLDLHPENVLLTPEGPVVIDWCNAEEGPPGLDWAMSALILAQVAVAAAPERAAAVRAVLVSLLENRGTEPGGHVGEARARRAADPNLTRDEIDRLDEAVALVRAGLG
ncbi:phosphotransferase [Nonomuraea sp. NPDC000554]|uniref:phosphotransferase n=1 Tax=Nonomuraea sp. NPDC000554 TaxID=3154259 RepID=UPI003323E3B1